jgi:tetratricopeptide (TPR) repeat protein
MTEANDTPLWQRLKHSLAFRIATLYAGASWFIVQAIDTLGAETTLTRAVAAVLVGGFVLLVPLLVAYERRATGTRRGSAVGDAALPPPAALNASAAASAGFAADRSSDDATLAFAPQPSRRDAVAGFSPRRSLRGTRAWAASLAVLLLVTAGLWGLGARSMRSSVPAAAERLAVLPFHASGSSEVRELGIGMVDLLTTALSDVGGISTVSSRTVLARVRRDAADALSLEHSIDVGRQVGAGAVLVGGVTGFGSSIRLSAEIHAVDSGTRLARAEVDGPQDSILALTDRLAVALLRELWRSRAPVPTVRIASLTTTSPAALREYLRGEDALRQLRFAEAVDSYRRALALDSTFALAWARLADATGWNESGEAAGTRREYTERAVAYSEPLPPRDRSFVRALHLSVVGALAAFDSLESYVARYPDDPMGWYHLGDARFHAAFLGLDDPDQILQPFLEATRLDPALALGLYHALDIAVDRGDRVLFDTLMAQYAPVAAPRLVRHREQQAAVRWALPDSVLPTFVALVRSLHPVEQRWEINQLIGTLGRRARLDLYTDPYVYVHGLDSIARMYGTDSYWIERSQLRVWWLASLGRTTEVFAGLDQFMRFAPPWIRALPPQTQVPFARVMFGIEAELPVAELEDDIRILEEQIAAAPMMNDVLHTVFLRSGDTQRAERYRPTNIMVPPGRAVDTAAVRIGTRGLLDIWRGDTIAGVRQIDEAVRQLGFDDAEFVGLPGDDYALVLARLPERREQAIRMLRSSLTRRALQSGTIYLTLARVLEEQDDRLGALEAYAHVVRLWRDAEPHRRAYYDEAREALVRLGPREGDGASWR